MANIKWGNKWSSIFVKKDQLREALSLPNDIMFGCWLGVVIDQGHEEAMRATWVYDSVLRDAEVDEQEAERRRREWNAGEGASVSDEEIERRRCGLSEWNGK
jgi:hypothetical protein